MNYGRIGMSAYSGLLTRVVDEGSDFASIFMMIVLNNFRQLTGALSSFFILTIAGYWCCQGEEIKKGTQNPKTISKGVATFDAAWKIIYETHFDTNFNGVDWVSVQANLRPKAEKAQSVDELRKVIGSMLELLGQSHMALIPNDVADAFDPDSIQEKPNELQKGEKPKDKRDSRDKSGNLGMDVRLVDGEMVVFRVEADGPAAEAHVKPGWIIRSIGGENVTERLAKLPEDSDPRRNQLMAWRITLAMLNGKPNSTVRVEFLDGKDKLVNQNIRRRRATTRPVKLGLLPTLYVKSSSEKLKSQDGLSIGLVRFNYWMIPVAAPIDKAIDEFRDSDGIIFDLRGNLGGIGGMVMGISGHFLKDRIALGTMKLRNSEIHFYSNPRLVNPSDQRVEPFSGPFAILIDSLSLSTSEIFAGGLQAIGRARIFGESTGGQALPALWDRLPNGDVLYHAFADYVTAADIRVEGRGIIPDEAVVLTRKDLLAGRDEPLQEAIRWISKQSTAMRTSTE